MVFYEVKIEIPGTLQNIFHKLPLSDSQRNR